MRPSRLLRYVTICSGLTALLFLRFGVPGGTLWFLFCVASFALSLFFLWRELL